MPLAFAVRRDDALEIAKEFRQALLQEIPRARRAPRAFDPRNIGLSRDRMMGVMDFGDKVRDRKLELMRPEPAGFPRWREPVAGAQEQQDVRGLADQQAAGLQKGRSEGRRRDLAAVEKAEHGARFPVSRHVFILDTGLFERQAHELAASLDGGPVIELVTLRHRALPWRHAARAAESRRKATSAGRSRRSRARPE